MNESMVAREDGARERGMPRTQPRGSKNIKQRRNGQNCPKLEEFCRYQETHECVSIRTN